MTKDNKICKKRLLNLIQNLGSKDIDMGIFQAIDKVFNDKEATIEDLLNCYYVDQVFVPALIHENIIDFIDKNSINNYSDKLDLCLEYYDNYITSQIIKKNMFGNWELNDYVGCLSTVSANYSLKKTKIKSVHSKKSIDKSSLISKYNYRYYNLKFINLLSKKLQIDIRNFHTLSLLVAHSVFINKDNLDYTIRKLKSIEIGRAHV